jgi:hypothetical protein
VLRRLAAEAVVAEALHPSGGRRLVGAGTVIARPTTITWTVPSTTVPARQRWAPACPGGSLDPGKGEPCHS